MTGSNIYRILGGDAGAIIMIWGKMTRMKSERQLLTLLLSCMILVTIPLG